MLRAAMGPPAFRWVSVVSASLYSAAVVASSAHLDAAGSAEKPPRRAPAKAEERGGRFAPRFDGLRFIETLVTAHR